MVLKTKETGTCLLVLALLVGASWAMAPARMGIVLAEEDPRVQNLANGHYYELVQVDAPGVNWYQARDAAAAMVYNGMPGHLATITDAQEENFLVSSFPEIYPEYVWLGASDEASEGDWQWITAEAWSYTDWADGEPNGGTFENCLQFGDFVAQWNDASCDRPFCFYLVEYSLEGPIAIVIDIKPGSDPNSINCNNETQVIALAILTTEDFDATTVDHTTVTFEGASEMHVNKKSGEPRRHEEDVDYDGDLDLVFHFHLGDTDLACNSTEGILTGETYDGQAIRGTDAVRMIDPTLFESPLRNDSQ